MLNYIDFTVPCRLHPGSKETFRVYYCKIDGAWIPLPVDICNNGCGNQSCLECAASVFRRACDQETPFLR